MRYVKAPWREIAIWIFGMLASGGFVASYFLLSGYSSRGRVGLFRRDVRVRLYVLVATPSSRKWITLTAGRARHEAALDGSVRQELGGGNRPALPLARPLAGSNRTRGYRRMRRGRAALRALP